MKENKMGTMPVNRLLLSMSLPMIVSMLVQAMYNIVDSIFVSRITENSMAAVSLSFPIQMLMIAVGGGTGIGVNAMLSKALGEKDYAKVNKVAAHGIFLAGASYVATAVVGLTLVKAFFRTQTVGADLDIYTQGVDYLTICCVCSFGMYAQFMFDRLLQSTGKTVYSMYTQGIGAVINIVLDPILIFGLFGFPKLGVAGAAYATVFSQSVAALISIIINLRKNHDIHYSFRGFRIDRKMIGKIYSVGIPSIIMQAIGSVMIYGMNRILMNFSSTATVVFGVYFRLNSFIFMPVFGLNNGMIPIVAYNYGARSRERLLKTAKLSMIYAICIMTVGFLIFQQFPDKLLLIFKASDDMLSIGVPALRIISISFPVAGFCIVVGSMFQALGNGIYSLLVSFARQLVVLLPVAYLLSSIWGLQAIWWAYPIAEVMSLTVSLFFYLRIKKRVIDPLGQMTS